ncbi:MAG TPA: GNAT family N-acetyltransferase [Amycolatopsis sp.]|nr:GNAT family N-acetyltransferase [Amycolatopsis sp.]
MIDPAVERQVPEDSVDEYGLRLVVVPPPTPAGIGAVRLCLGHKILGEIRMSLCATDRRAVLVHLHIDEECRRRGAGRVLVAAAEARGIDFNWTMVPIERDPVSIAFWARLGTFGSASASPRPCSHQIEAGVIPACD